MLGDQLKLSRLGGDGLDHQVLDTDIDACLDLGLELLRSDSGEWATTAGKRVGTQ